MTAKIILNPYSNRWNAKARWPEADLALKKAGVDFELAVSEHPRHTIELAEQAAREGFSPIIAAGGDGTIGEVVNGLARAAKSDQDLLGPFGILPLGSANDLVDNLGLPRDLNEAAQVIASGKTRLMDIGYVNGFYFANNSAIGLEPYITLAQQRITWIKGMARYLVAAVRGIWDNPQWNAKIEWDDGQLRRSGPARFGWEWASDRRCVFYGASRRPFRWETHFCPWIPADARPDLSIAAQNNETGAGKFCGDGRHF